MKYLAHFFSIVFHPIFIPLFAFLGYSYFDHYSTVNINKTPLENYLWLVLILIVFTVIFPVYSIYIMKKAKIISDYKLSNRKERIPVLIASFIYLAVYYYLIRNIEFTKSDVVYFGAFLSVIFGGLVVSLLCIVITYYWKISLHAAAVSGLSGAFLGLSYSLFPLRNPDTIILLFSTSLLIIGLVSSSRLYLKSHSFLQVIAGMFLGFIVAFYIVKNEFLV